MRTTCVLRALGKGLVINATGPHTLRFLPPLVCEEQATWMQLVERLSCLLGVIGPPAIASDARRLGRSRRPLYRIFAYFWKFLLRKRSAHDGTIYLHKFCTGLAQFSAYARAEWL